MSLHIKTQRNKPTKKNAKQQRPLLTRRVKQTKRSVPRLNQTRNITSLQNTRRRQQQQQQQHNTFTTQQTSTITNNNNNNIFFNNVMPMFHTNIKKYTSLLVNARQSFSTAQNNTTPITTQQQFEIPTLSTKSQDEVESNKSTKTSTPTQPPSAMKLRAKKYLRRVFRIVGLTMLCAAIGSSISAYPMLAHPVSQALESETAALLGATFDQMAPLGLMELKLVPDRVINGMADPDNLRFATDPNVIVERPEIGHFINSASILKGEFKPSDHSLPHRFDPINMNEPDTESPVRSFIHRVALRNQYTDFIKECYELYQYGLNAIFFQNQNLPAAISMAGPEQLSWVYAMNLPSNPIRALERAIDVLFVRNNDFATKLNILAQRHIPEDFSAHAPRERALELGNEIQHYMLDQSTKTGRLLQNADDKFIHRIALPDPENPLIKDHPFSNELLNIPEHIKNHPDRTVTGPLFEYYYNIFSRNAYNNILVEENKFLVNYRDTLLEQFKPLGLIAPEIQITGIDHTQLNHPALETYSGFAKATIDSRVNHYNVQTPLLPQPFHYFQSTGTQIDALPDDIALTRKFKDIMPKDLAMSDVPIFREHLIPEQPPATIERYAVVPRMGPETAPLVDTRSILSFNSQDKANFEWDYVNQLPSRYQVDSRSAYIPELAQDLSRILTKMDLVILRNQYEMERVQNLGLENNPKIKQLYDELAIAQKIPINGVITGEENNSATNSDGTTTESTEAAPFWKFW